MFAVRYLPLVGRQVSAVVSGRPVALAQLVHFGKQRLMNDEYHIAVIQNRFWDDKLIIT